MSTLPGFEAPRNSMEFAMEASHSYGVFQEDVPVSLVPVLLCQRNSFNLLLPTSRHCYFFRKEHV